MEWITTPDVHRETWRRLREFANPEFATEVIASIHGAAKTNRTSADYRKQAEQVRAAILQASEYFDAARTSSLVTSPNHVYYGLVSLASAVMLLLGDGEASFDFLRKEAANRHHGLEFSQAFSASDARRGLALLERSRVRVSSRGHFANWYCRLPRRTPLVGLRRVHGDNHILSTWDTVGFDEWARHEELCGTSRSTLDAIMFLPDLAGDLFRYGVNTPHSRISQEMDIHEKAKQLRMQWRIHDAGSSENLFRLLEGFEATLACAHQLDCVMQGERGARVTHTISLELPGPGAPTMRWPTSRDTLDGRRYLYAAIVGTPEFVDFYLAAFALSNLSRYYPDLWFACLESHCKAAQLLDRWVAVALQKCPLLALNLLARDTVVVSTDKAPWYS